ncbi:BatD family protein [Vibrio intestinalis]|uniref:BatD family protein n=1 Tax=Vibrio intestinalis TaxID=2933291 RepID=UPI0021A336F8|nr:BatD family protein [Vibrio intestinalis]
MLKRRVASTFILLLACFTISTPTWAATLKALVSNNKVVENQVFNLKVVFDEHVDSDAIDFSVLENNFIVSQPRFNTSFRIINGSRSSSSEWVLSLVPKGVGNTTIPAFEVEGQRSQPIQITVTRDGALPKQDELIAVVSKLDKQQLYPSESATLKVRVIIKRQARQFKDSQFSEPTAQGLEISKQGKDQQFNTVINGVEATVIDKNYTITAENAGKYEIVSSALKGTVIYQSQQGSTRFIPIDIEPETFMLTVSAKPSDYQGHWLPASQLELTQQWFDSNGNPLNPDAVKLTVGDSLTREINLDIDGLAPERFPNLPLTYPSQLRVYSEKPSFTELENGLRRMTLRQVVIPQQSGEVALPELSLPWWNSLAEQQQTAYLTGLQLNVNEAPNANPAIAPQALRVAAENMADAPEVIVERGIWPYLTGLFALLWLVTLGWALKRPAKEPTNQERPTPSQDNDNSIALLTSLQAKDWSKALHLAKTWLNSQQGKDVQLIKHIEQELAEMSQAIYSETPKDWQPTTLIKLIKKLNKSKVNTKQPSSLAKL